VLFVTGSDAARRIVEWDYAGRERIEDQLREYELLVAPRVGAYDAPPHLRVRVTSLELAEEFQRISSTELRRRVREGPDWRALAAPGTEELVARHYGR
jgi:nicotinic acid mononucleotide adenylyltransferase